MQTSIFTKFLFLFWYSARLSSSIAAPRFFSPSLTYSSREKQIASKSSVVIEGISNSDGMGILIAAKDENFNALKKALADKNNDINAKDGDGYTALYWSIIYGNKGMASILLQNENIDLNLKYKNGETAVIAAIRDNQDYIAQELLKKDLNINTQDDDGKTALIYATQKSKTSIVHQLLNKGASIRIKDNDQANAFMYSCASGNLDIVKLMVSNGRFNINAKDENGCSALILGLYADNPKILEFLLSLPGINVDVKSPTGHNILILASSAGKTKSVELLLSRPGINLNSAAPDGWNPLTLACYMKHHDIAKMLINHPKIDVNFKGYDEQTPLMITSGSGQFEVTKKLLSHKNILVNKEKSNGLTALIYAAKEGDARTLRLLIKNGADVEIEVFCTKPGDKPNTEILSFKKAIDIAREEGHTKVIEILEDKKFIEKMKKIASNKKEGLWHQVPKTPHNKEPQNEEEIPELPILKYLSDDETTAIGED